MAVFQTPEVLWVALDTDERGKPMALRGFRPFVGISPQTYRKYVHAFIIQTDCSCGSNKERG